MILGNCKQYRYLLKTIKGSMINLNYDSYKLITIRCLKKYNNSNIKTVIFVVEVGYQ